MVFPYCFPGTIFIYANSLHLGNATFYWLSYDIAGPNVRHPSAPTPSIDYKKDEIPVSAPPNETPTPLSPMSHFPAKGMHY